MLEKARQQKKQIESGNFCKSFFSLLHHIFFVFLKLFIFPSMMTILQLQQQSILILSAVSRYCKTKTAICFDCVCRMTEDETELKLITNSSTMRDRPPRSRWVSELFFFTEPLRKTSTFILKLLFFSNISIEMNKLWSLFHKFTS